MKEIKRRTDRKAPAAANEADIAPTPVAPAPATVTATDISAASAATTAGMATVDTVDAAPASADMTNPAPASAAAPDAADAKTSKKAPASAHIYWQLFVTFFELGLFTFGGGMAMVSILQDVVCTKRGWMTEEEVVDCLAVSQSLPGVIAINMATYTGFFLRGLPGALVASLGMILPSFVIIILVVCFLREFQENPYIQGALTGIKAAACGLVAFAAIKLGRQILKSAFAWVIAIASFVAIAVFDVDAVFVILAGIGVGLLHTVFTGSKSAARAAERADTAKGDAPAPPPAPEGAPASLPPSEPAAADMSPAAAAPPEAEAAPAAASPAAEDGWTPPPADTPASREEVPR